LDSYRLFEICAEWRRVLAAPEGYKKASHSESLRDLLPKLDETLGVAIRSLVGNRDLSRLTIVPHLCLHGAPFWALPSLESFQIAITPSAGQLVSARKKASLARRAVVIGDPTLDLPLSRVEARSVDGHLLELGLDVAVVIGQEATVNRVTHLLTEAGLLGTLCVRLGGVKLQWNSAQLKVTNQPEANALVHYHYRKGWSL
jgi:hypothetical protein